MKKTYFFVPIIFLLLSCVSQHKIVDNSNYTMDDYDSVIIYYISPQIETFDPISISDFLKMGEYNYTLIKGRDTLNCISQSLKDTVSLPSECIIDTRFMIIYFGKQRDTLYHDSFSKIAIPNGKIYSDSNYVAMINKIISSRDSIFPSTRLEFKDGRYIMK